MPQTILASVETPPPPPYGQCPNKLLQGCFPYPNILPQCKTALGNIIHCPFVIIIMAVAVVIVMVVVVSYPCYCLQSIFLLTAFRIYLSIREEELKLGELQRLPLLSDLKPNKVHKFGGNFVNFLFRERSVGGWHERRRWRGVGAFSLQIRQTSYLKNAKTCRLSLTSQIGIFSDVQRSQISLSLFWYEHWIVKNILAM